jgi:hypothetical protein
MQAKDRYGNVYNKGDIVQMKEYPVLYRSMIGRPIEIMDIKEYECCESGFNVLLKDMGSGNVFKKWIDTNWIQKTNQ